jgi:hypothetical protein
MEDKSTDTWQGLSLSFNPDYAQLDSLYVNLFKTITTKPHILLGMGFSFVDPIGIISRNDHSLL